MVNKIPKKKKKKHLRNGDEISQRLNLYVLLCPESLKIQMN